MRDLIHSALGLTVIVAFALFIMSSLNLAVKIGKMTAKPEQTQTECL